MTELERLLEKLRTVKKPEDLFGPVEAVNEDEVKKNFRLLVKVVHPDHNPTAKKQAEEAFTLLNKWTDIAYTRLKDGTYGKVAAPPKIAPVEVKNRKTVYTVLDPLAKSDIANLYRCTHKEGRKTIESVFKIVRNPRDNDLAENEVRVLTRINKEHNSPYFAQLNDSFAVTDGKSRKHVSIFPYSEDFVSLEEVLNTYPNGLDVRDVVWMYNRLLEGLFFTSKTRMIHGSVLPQNVLIGPKNHGLVLTEWSYSVELGKGGLKAISSNYEDWYPPEVKKKEKATFSIDIFMATMCAIKLLGGDPVKRKIPATCPTKITNFFKSCLIDSPTRRPYDAGELREEWGKLCEEIFGKRKYRPLNMPERKPRTVA